MLWLCWVVGDGVGRCDKRGRRWRVWSGLRVGWLVAMRVRGEKHLSAKCRKVPPGVRRRGCSLRGLFVFVVIACHSQRSGEQDVDGGAPARQGVAGRSRRRHGTTQRLSRTLREGSQRVELPGTHLRGEALTEPDTGHRARRFHRGGVRQLACPRRSG